VERMWRSTKHEKVYLRVYADGWEAEISLAKFFWRFCLGRLQSALGGRISQQAFDQLEPCVSPPRLTISGGLAVQFKPYTSCCRILFISVML
jgi:putative transposase